MNTSLFIDGFNFYYGCYGQGQNATSKWLDLRSLFAVIFPNDTIHRIHYCTAKISGTPADPDKPVRQQTYIEALEATPRLTIHYGKFHMRRKYGDLVTPIACQVSPTCVPTRVTVEVPEEKGSDVNLATALLRDAFTNDFDQAVVVSNDTDLIGAIRVVRLVAGLPVVVVSPHATLTPRLKKAATAGFVLDQTLLARHQFPSPLTLPSGRLLRKPKSW
jgi:hypothetical protein